MASWALKPETLKALDQALGILQPRLIVEAGSGESTVILNAHAPTVSLEHSHLYAQSTLRLCRNADIRLCRISPLLTLDGVWPWYDEPLPDDIDFALIDGPPSAIGRQAALFAIWPHLSSKWEIWLDDFQRPHEQECLVLWRKHFDFTETPVNMWALRLNPT